MSVTFELAQDYPASIAQLWQALGQRDYIETKYHWLGCRALQITRLDSEPDRIEVDLERDVHIEPTALPAWARWLVEGRHRLRHRSRWLRRAGQVAAELDVSLPGQPVRAKGTGEVVEIGRAHTHTRMTLKFKVDCDVPVIGSKVAGLFADLVKRALEADHQFTVRYLTH